MCLEIAFLSLVGSRFVMSSPFFPSFNPVYYIVWTGLPDASSEVRGWPVWRRHGRH